ncbi:PBSX family phage terminase large subunit [Erysipelotrichaceae bacterium OH741_COT-311]|nr:PBSX family phage terminase large subunit [Erysipelotrichaceae bacterium OH741_COT-311]
MEVMSVANSKNLIKTTDMPKAKHLKMSAKGGKKSAEEKKKKKSIEESMRLLLSMPANEKIQEKIKKSLGVDEEVDNAMAIAVSTYQQALKGNTKAIELCQRFNGIESDKQLLDIKKAELKIKQEQHNVEMAEYNKRNNVQEDTYKGIPALNIAPSFASVLHDMHEHNHLEYVLEGGRGSTKSSFISLTIIDLMMKYENLNALVMRQVSNTLKDSVYNQLIWAIDQLGLNSEFHATKNPVEITRIRTGQKIFFRGADDPNKVKSIKVPFGYIGILWFEELDQFLGPESIRKIEQSAIRGGDLAWIFKSFNPPKSAINWANKYTKLSKANRLVHKIDYRSVPAKWLGVPFIEEAEFLKEINPIAYEHEYLGEANGTGGNVFENIVIRKITDEEIKEFDRIGNGVDWGWYPDPFAYNRAHYDSARLTLYIFKEFRANKMSNEKTAQELKEKYIEEGEIVICDSAENKSIGDYRTYGIAARAAEKGPGSVDYSMKWLQSLKAIVIDDERCPHTATEFIEYEYERDKEGNIITGYPDKNNHHIDAVRYATNPIWKRRGQ